MKNIPNIFLDTVLDGQLTFHINRKYDFQTHMTVLHDGIPIAHSSYYDSEYSNPIWNTSFILEETSNLYLGDAFGNNYYNIVKWIKTKLEHDLHYSSGNIIMMWLDTPITELKHPTVHEIIYKFIN